MGINEDKNNTRKRNKTAIKLRRKIIGNRKN
jgi:hypothetical protein